MSPEVGERRPARLCTGSFLLGSVRARHGRDPLGEPAATEASDRHLLMLLDCRLRCCLWTPQRRKDGVKCLPHVYDTSITSSSSMPSAPGVCVATTRSPSNLKVVLRLSSSRLFWKKASKTVAKLVLAFTLNFFGGLSRSRSKMEKLGRAVGGGGGAVCCTITSSLSSSTGLFSSARTWALRLRKWCEQGCR